MTSEAGGELRTPFLSTSFLEPYLRFIAPTRGEIFFEGPLVSSRRGPFKVLHTAGAGIADYMELDLAHEEVAEQKLVGWIQSRSFDVLVVRNVPSSSATGTFLQSVAHAHDWAFKRVQAGVAPFVLLKGDWESFFRQTRSKKSRHNLNRSARRLKEMGGRIVHYTSPDDVAAGVDAAAAIVQAEPRGMNSRWSMANPQARPFYRSVATRFAEENEFDLALLEIEGAPAAFAWSIKRESTWYYHYARSRAQGTAAPFSPGSVLLVHLLQRAVEEGFHVFDFMLGDEPYKRAWATGDQVVYSYFLATQSWRGLSAWRTELGLLTARLSARRIPAARRAAGILARRRVR